ncbi:hypothetical protein J2X06_000544 [Lysobacter niastensis]|uniref:DUF748 domain-containing protein n=1 Tax=Lysobacter niastensis TaxID=380629 RepID=A0ABU1W7Q5_9GAMM|nr:DUF748 domain-containing protein [Lysobacter niastensis]MDR7133360.1 hypothetical protein [Lysobacter niastensis]
MNAARLLRNWLILIPVLLVLAVGLYAAAGFWLVPRLIRSQATDYVSTELHKSLSLGDIRFNPFTFELDMRDIAIADQARRSGRRPVVALRRLYLDFQASSLWRRAYTFRQVELEAPYADTIIRPDGSLNLADLLPKPEQPDEPLPHVWIEDLSVHRGHIDFADRSRRRPLIKVLSPIEFRLKDFHTTPAGGGFRLAAASEEGERFVWAGQLSLRPLASDGRLRISALKARSVYEFIGDELPFQLTQGRFDLGGQYRFSVVPKSGMRLDATLPDISATGLGLRARGVDDDWVSVPKATLANTRVSLQESRITIDTLRVSGLKATLWREADGSLNIERLLEDTDASAAPASASASADDWKFALGRLELDQADVSLEDRTVTPATPFHLAPLALTASGLSLALDKPVPITVHATVNGKAPLTIEGEVVPQTAAAKLRVDVSKLPLLDVKPYLPDYPALELKSGIAAAEGELTLEPEDAPGPDIRFVGEANVTAFELIEAASKRPFVSWDRLDALDLDYTTGPDALTVRTVRIARPFARVIVAPDRSVNLITLFGDSETAAGGATGKSIATKSTPTRSRLLRPDAARPAPKAASSEPTMPITIGKLVLASGTMSFADYSIQPNFQARIEALRGSITGLSIGGPRLAKIDLAGHVINRYSPVRITGETNLLEYDQHTDIGMEFRNIELPIFNPYSDRYAGYAIAKGKLTTKLHYRIDDRKLAADHHIVVDQLQWGEATDSKEKVSLPIRLATSLLKDRNGVINLDLPVTGTLDDPKFRLWPVIWQIIKNLVVKIVTAPFDFIGSLFKGAEQAQFVEFAPGSAELPEGAKSALASLAQGLADRPALQLDVPAGPGIEADAAALTEQRMLAALASIDSRKGPKYAELDRGDKIDVLEDLYRQDFGNRPRPPDAAASEEDTTRKERRASRKDSEIEWLEEQLRPRYRVAQDELVKLGQARATAVQEALLAGGAIDPARVFLAANLQVEGKDDKVRMKLSLE